MSSSRSAGRLAGKTVLISGGSRGIGRAMALACAKEGANVVISYKSRSEEAHQVVEEIKRLGRKALEIKADISKVEDCNNLAQKAKEFLGQIDVLINNAGVYFQKSFLDSTEKDYEAIMGPNVKGTFFLTLAVNKMMIADGRGGSVINISSFRDKAVRPGLAIYSTSKNAITMFSKLLAAEMKQGNKKIRVNTISPGVINTDMHRDMRENQPLVWAARIEQGLVAEPEELMGLVIWLASDESQFVTGSRFLIDGGASLQQTAAAQPQVSGIKAKL